MGTGFPQRMRASMSHSVADSRSGDSTQRARQGTAPLTPRAQGISGSAASSGASIRPAHVGRKPAACLNRVRDATAIWCTRVLFRNSTACDRFSIGFRLIENGPELIVGKVQPMIEIEVKPASFRDRFDLTP